MSIMGGGLGGGGGGEILPDTATNHIVLKWSKSLFCTVLEMFGMVSTVLQDQSMSWYGCVHRLLASAYEYCQSRIKR